ncbi:MAG: YkgJ family cysteine cluster protein [Nitrospirae bacterium]|nr:YkgJ family cysteine cluster protein [Nitrospirota bacterium]
MTYKINNIVHSADCIKCDICCYFDQDEADCTPCFTQKEYEAIAPQLQEKLKMDDTGYYRPLLQSPQKNNEYSSCAFLIEKSHECGIYGVRPLDCELWPFRIAYANRGTEGQRDRDVALIVVSKEICPAMCKSMKIAPEIIDEIIFTLQQRKVFAEIVRGERHVYGNEPFHIYQRSIQKYVASGLMPQDSACITLSAKSGKTKNTAEAFLRVRK